MSYVIPIVVFVVVIIGLFCCSPGDIALDRDRETAVKKVTIFTCGTQNICSAHAAVPMVKIIYFRYGKICSHILF